MQYASLAIINANTPSIRVPVDTSVDVTSK
jgi:hypothetical protein